MFEPVSCAAEIYGKGENQLICGDVMTPPRELRALYGQVQCVYVDPPFMTGERFVRTRPYGTKGWKRGSPTVRMTGYADRYTDEREYLRFLRKTVRTAWRLLNETGVFYLHLDWRMIAQGKLICDQVFGRDRFLNEIIWSYESGGRTKKYFSRKHETILLYARGESYQFDITRAPLDRRTERKNHMARKMDEDGRMYSSITLRGKEYRYYDDEPVYPGDVWTDISHLQQRDPERTGYPTQKPLKLLERLLLPVTRPGDWVVDLCCGSGTTLEAAQKLDCRFLGLDNAPEAIAISLARLKADNLTVRCPTQVDGAQILIREDGGRFRMDGIETGDEALPKSAAPQDTVEAWETGTITGQVFRAERRFQRSHRYPELTLSLLAEPGEIQAILLTDVMGVRRLYVRKEEASPMDEK